MAFLPRRTSRGEAAFLAGRCAAPFSVLLLLNVSAINSPLTKSSFEDFGNSAEICTNYTVKPREKQPEQNKYNEAARAASTGNSTCADLRADTGMLASAREAAEMKR